MELHIMRDSENATVRPTVFTIFTEHNRKLEKEWLTTNWAFSLYAVAAYLAFIYFGQKFMKERKPFDLQNSLVLWNCMLAAFSIYGCFIMVPEFFADFRGPHGLYKSICTSWELRSPAAFHWAFLFLVSKLPELFDTAFVVLRKKPLIFLHWYHHVTVLLYCWYTATDENSTGQWFATMNFVVHSMMYTYYGIRAMKIQIPSKISMLITGMQLLQMVAGLFVVLYATTMKLNAVECSTKLNSLYLALGMYASYFLLFGNFFFKAYLDKKAKRKLEKNK